MSLFSKLGRLGQKSLDQAVGITSGQVPAKVLDGPRAFPLILGLVVVALGVSSWLVWRTLYPTATAHKTSNTNSTPVAQLEKLRSKDTDGDGLSDYDELFGLHTSPYLKDTDSDGIPDNVELSQGSDPNCPQGKSCNTISSATSITDASGNLTPQFLRQSLVASGVPQTTVDQISDTDILQIYSQATAGDVNADANASVDVTLNNLKNMSTADIRQLLINSGLDKGSLSQIDDDTLKQIFQQAIQQNSNDLNTNQ